MASKKPYTLPAAEHKNIISLSQQVYKSRERWWQLWREIGDYFLPQKAQYLSTQAELKDAGPQLSDKILDSTGTIAGGIASNGLMNGVSSPSRPWFFLTIEGLENDREALIWLGEVRRVMSVYMERSNFYQTLNQVYTDMVFFGTSAMMIYEHVEKGFTCYHSPIGEYALGINEDQQVDVFSRRISRNVRQIVKNFGIENVSQKIKDAYTAGGARLLNSHTIHHLVAPNTAGHVSSKFEFVDYYWEKGAEDGKFLRIKGYHESPGLFPRYDITGNETYGTSPGLKALPVVKQLQLEVRRKLQGIDGMVRPHLLLPLALRNKAGGMLPGGKTYTNDPNNGAKAAYESRIPVGEMRMDIQDLRMEIKRIFHNDLFQMVSELDTVRSATEIDARREEKLVQLGPLLKRTDNEALDVALQRIFSILFRKGKFPTPPASITNARSEVTIQYTSLLHAAQKAVATVPVERLLQLVGNSAQVWPEATKKVDILSTIDYYAGALGVEPSILRDTDDIMAELGEERESAQMDQNLERAGQAVQGAETLSRTDVGGGSNALQQLLAQS